MMRSIDNLLVAAAVMLITVTASFGISEILLLDLDLALGTWLVRGHAVALLLFFGAAVTFLAGKRALRREPSTEFERTSTMRRVTGFRLAGVVLLALGAGVLTLLRYGFGS